MSSLQQPPFRETGGIAAGDDDVIQDPNVKPTQGSFKRFMMTSSA
jgi:hypothetical protein